MDMYQLKVKFSLNFYLVFEGHAFPYFLKLTKKNYSVSIETQLYL